MQEGESDAEEWCVTESLILTCLGVDVRGPSGLGMSPTSFNIEPIGSGSISAICEPLMPSALT